MLRKITARLAVAAVSMSTTLALATPAYAATSLSACFTWSTGSAYVRQPVYLGQWNGAKWVSIRNGATNASGCATFSNVPSTRYTTMWAYKAVGDKNIGMALHGSPTNNWALPGSGAANLGRKTVSLTQCTWGLYDWCAGMN